MLSVAGGVVGSLGSVGGVLLSVFAGGLAGGVLLSVFAGGLAGGVVLSVLSLLLLPAF